jgi:hypothetical protein
VKVNSKCRWNYWGSLFWCLCNINYWSCILQLSNAWEKIGIHGGSASAVYSWIMSEVWYNILTEFDTPMNLYPGTQLCDHRSRGNILELLKVCGLHFIESQTVVGWIEMCLNEIPSKVWRGKRLSDVLAVQNSL